MRANVGVEPEGAGVFDASAEFIRRLFGDKIDCGFLGRRRNPPSLVVFEAEDDITEVLRPLNITGLVLCPESLARLCYFLLSLLSLIRAFVLFLIDFDLLHAVGVHDHCLR